MGAQQVLQDVWSEAALNSYCILMFAPGRVNTRPSKKTTVKKAVTPRKTLNFKRNLSRQARQATAGRQMYVTRANLIKNISETSQVGFLIAHGLQLPTEFTIPNNVHVVFLSDPGYPLDAGVINAKYRRLAVNLRMFREFIRGTLTQTNIPDQLKLRNWKWYEHVYLPSSKCKNMDIEVYDRRNPILDHLVGLRYAGPDGQVVQGLPGSNSTGRLLYGQHITLRDVCEKVSMDTRNHGGCVLFVTSCRISITNAPGYVYYHPELGRSFQRAFQESGGRQNYRVPTSQITINTRALENLTKRYASRKRVASNIGNNTRTPRNALNAAVLQSRTPKNAVINMIRHIQNNNFTLARARTRFPFFFRNMSDANSLAIIQGIRRSNNQLTNNVRALYSLNHSNYRVGEGPTPSRIIARMRNMGLFAGN